MLLAAMVDPATNQPHLDWGQAIVVGAVLLGWTSAVVARALRARSTVPLKLREQRARTKSAITSLTIVPAIAEVVVNTHGDIDWGDQQATPVRAELIEQTAAVVMWSQADMVETLSAAYVDRADCDRLPKRIVAWLQFQGCAAGGYCLPAIYFVVSISIRNYELPLAASYAAGLVMAVAITLFVVGLLQEIRARNRLAGIFERYEP